MMRSLVVIICIFCVATIMSQAVGLAFLWNRGQLNSETVEEIRVILSGQFGDVAGDGEEEDASLPSSEDIMKERSKSILGLDRREKELSLIKLMVDENAVDLGSQLDAFERKEKAFELKMVELNNKLTAEATEQTRGLLMKLEPADAVLYLMELDLNENVILLKGMPDKKIAELLQEFLQAGDQKQVTRGNEIFEALSKGEPAASLIENSKNQPVGKNDPTT